MEKYQSSEFNPIDWAPEVHEEPVAIPEAPVMEQEQDEAAPELSLEELAAALEAETDPELRQPAPKEQTPPPAAVDLPAPKFDLYRDMASRTQGQIYFGLVGPVRTGKSTFIKRFMEAVVLPVVEDTELRTRMMDELPQSGSGRTIMTTQPHFVPEQGAQINIGETSAKIRLVDCVGYPTRGALGYLEDGEPRRVRTPWSDAEIPFEEAAEIGTRRVIDEHATVGIVVTSDGSVTELPRSSYVEAEERAIAELKKLGKPFVVVLNTRDPSGQDAIKLADALTEKYGVSVEPMDVLNMQKQQIDQLLSSVLLEFPLREVRVNLPPWANSLPASHWLPTAVLSALREGCTNVTRMRHAQALLPVLEECDCVTGSSLGMMQLADGSVTLEVVLREGLYYDLLSEACGMEVKGDYHLLQLLREFAEAKRAYDRYNEAIQSALDTGYGMVSPTLMEMVLDEPQITRAGGRFGVKLKASAPSLHLLRVAVESEVSPIIGTEKQSEEMLQYLLSEFDGDRQRIWETNFFGKSLHDMVQESLAGKLQRMPENIQNKMTYALTRIINDGANNMFCFLV